MDSLASGFLADGDAKLEEHALEDAFMAFKEARAHFERAGDDIGALGALNKQLGTLIEKGDVQEALIIAQEKQVQFRAKWNLIGEVCVLEHIIHGHSELQDLAAAEKVARKALEHFKEYEVHGIDTTRAQAFMWYRIGEKCLALRDMDGAVDAAEVATRLFSDVGEYEYESLAVKLYNQATSQQSNEAYMEVDKHNFYLNVRIGGIAYGPRYRDNHVMMVKPQGSQHVACVLQLTCEEAEEWEHDISFHAGLIDAGAHSFFLHSERPEHKAAQAQAREDPNHKPEGPTIPFQMHHGELRPRANNSDMYINNVPGNDDPQVYLFSH